MAATHSRWEESKMDIFKGNGLGFVQIPGSLEQIAVGDFQNRAVWGINASSDIFRLNPGSNLFEQVAGKLTSISVGDANSVGGINASSDIFRFNPSSNLFEQVAGKLT